MQAIHCTEADGANPISNSNPYAHCRRFTDSDTDGGTPTAALTLTLSLTLTLIFVLIGGILHQVAVLEPVPFILDCNPTTEQSQMSPDGIDADALRTFMKEADVKSARLQ